MVEPLLSIVIPTRNRADLLLGVVERLLSQERELDGWLEIVIVDDGSKAGNLQAFLTWAASHSQGDRIRYVHQSPRGPAAARNQGIRAARAAIILFLGDDILPLPGLLRSHYLAHTVEYAADNIAVLGLADLAPELCLTRFSNWWRKWNFRYEKLLSKRCEPDFSYFYTNNLSLKRSFLLENGLFDESFRDAAYEDGELGFRLTQRGLKIVFKPEAKALHYHLMDLEAACQRMVVRGRSYDQFVEKTGALGISRLWMRLGSGFWMWPSLIRPLYKLCDYSQIRLNLSVVYIVVLMYFFQVGRGKLPSLYEG
jgi:glycosyltransferase involved in cell wall biosynthesis